MMDRADNASPPAETFQIELREPVRAAILAWLWPGAGHLFQRRYAKGVLFMVGILTLYFLGLAIGDGHVVYASWTKEDRRWHYFCQLGVGLPSLPALAQAYLVFHGRPPLCYGFMAPPRQPVLPEAEDELARWHAALGAGFDLGTLYTMIAGLLNVLAIYDAYAGPFMVSADKKDEGQPTKSS